MRSSKRTSALAAAVAAFTLGALVGPPASAVTSSQVDVQRSFPEVAPSDSLATATLASGRVSSAHAGTPVVLLAVPQGNTRVGDSTTLTPIAVDVVDGFGRYDLRAPSIGSFGSARDPRSGLVEMRVVFLTTSSSLLPVAFTASVTGHGSRYAVSQSTFGDSANGPTARAAHVEPTPGALAVRRAGAFQEVAATPASGGGGTCRLTDVQNLGRFATRLAQHWSSSPKAKVTFTFSQGNSVATAFGFAVSATGSKWKSGGKITKKFTSSTPYSTETGAKKIAYFKNTTLHKFKLDCVAYTEGGTPIRTIRYEARPVALTGSSVAQITDSTPATKADWCDGYYNGALDVDRGRNTEYSNGLDTSGQLGVDLSSQSGYETNVKVAIRSVSEARLVICGRSGYPETSSTGDIIIKKG